MAKIKNGLRHTLKPLLTVPDDYINVGARMREQWVAEKAKSVPKGARVLDAGAGEAPYKHLFTHTEYKTQDFAQYKGQTKGPQVETWHYDSLDYISDIASIPVPDESFDVILCTETFEHIPHPIETLREFSRILVPSGRLFITAPLAAGLHQEPYHFYGYTPHFYRKYFRQFDLSVVEITPTGGLMKHVAQETYRAGRTLAEKAPHRLSWFGRYVLLYWLPRYLGHLDDEVFVKEFTVGYMVEGRKNRSKSAKL